jgi:hypothetical protein
MLASHLGYLVYYFALRGEPGRAFRVREIGFCVWGTRHSQLQQDE